jgi:membrane protease YdiL (CAAX protease family)
MIRFLLLILIGAITFAILYFANHPEAFDDIWLYVIGLAGAIVKFFRIFWDKLKNFGQTLEKEIQKPAPNLPPVIQPQNQNQNDAVG